MKKWGIILTACMIIIATFSNVIRGRGANSSNLWIEKASTPEAGGYGEAIIGTGEAIYVVRCMYASSKPEFWRYDPYTNTWSNMPTDGLPTGAFRNGACLAYKPDYIFALLGGRYTDDNRTLFYKFNLNGTSWQRLSDTPHAQGAGDALIYCGYDGNLYAFLGDREHGSVFARYFLNNDTWQILPSIWDKTDDGCSLVWAGGEYIYALQGEIYETTPNNKFARYNIINQTWEELSPIPETNGVGDGASLLWIGGDVIYALGGGSCSDLDGDGSEDPGYNFYCYYITNDTWVKLGEIPYPVGYYVGNRLAYVNDGIHTSIYYWQGAPSTWEGGGKKFCLYRYMKWIPSSSDVEIIYKKGVDLHSYIIINITLYNTAYSVKNWGEIEREGNNFWIDSYPQYFIGFSLQMITKVSHTYDLGILEAGYYNFSFKAWGTPVKNMMFQVKQYGVDLSCDDPEKVIFPCGFALYNITVKNTGSEFDIISLELPPPCYCGWFYSLDNYTLELSPGESANVILNVSTIWETPGLFWEVKVTGISQNDPTISDFIITNTTIVSQSILKLVPEKAFIPLNSTFSFDLVIDKLPNGLAGYNISLQPSSVWQKNVIGGIVNIINVTFPEWASLHEWGKIGGDGIIIIIPPTWLKALDLNDYITQNATNVTLATITVKANFVANGSLNISINRLDDDNGYPIDVVIQNATITVFEALPGYNPPTDPDGDGLYEDINGNGLIDFDDVVEFFQHFEWMEQNWDSAIVDFNGNGLLDFDDIVELFKEV